MGAILQGQSNFTKSDNFSFKKRMEKVKVLFGFHSPQLLSKSKEIKLFKLHGNRNAF